MQATVLAITRDMERSEWLKWRTKGIGGSDVSAIAKMNKWKSPIAVWMEKTGQIELEEEQSEAAYWGTILEDAVAKEFEIRTGKKVRRRNAILQHPQYPFMIANVDRIIVGADEGLECKTTSEYMKDEWKDDEVPAPYLLQVQHYMAVTGYKAWWIAVLIGGNKFIHKRIERDEELIAQIIEIEKDFWLNHVEKMVPPELDGSEASTELLKVLYPEARQTEIDLPNEAQSLVDALDQINIELKELETRKNEYENRLKQMLGENERGRIGERVVTWKNICSNRFDSKTFAHDHPDLYEQYLKPSTYRKFAVK